jgi:hypothetical protein
VKRRCLAAILALGALCSAVSRAPPLTPTSVSHAHDDPGRVAMAAARSPKSREPHPPGPGHQRGSHPEPKPPPACSCRKVLVTATSMARSASARSRARLLRAGRTGMAHGATPRKIPRTPRARPKRALPAGPRIRCTTPPIRGLPHPPRHLDERCQRV